MYDFKQVSKEEFDEFIKNFPRRLEREYHTIGDPAVFLYNDFTAGNDSVAKVDLYDGSEYYDFKQPEYFIKSA